MRRAARIDENQPDIVKELRDSGCSVQSLAGLGKGCPDLLVGRRGRNWLFEVKNPEKPAADQQLTDDQVTWHGAWRGEVHTIWTAEQAFRIIYGEYP